MEAFKGLRFFGLLFMCVGSPTFADTGADTGLVDTGTSEEAEPTVEVVQHDIPVADDIACREEVLSVQSLGASCYGVVFEGGACTFECLYPL